mgnify:CR=1 FL=1
MERRAGSAGLIVLSVFRGPAGDQAARRWHQSPAARHALLNARALAGRMNRSNPPDANAERVALSGNCKRAAGFERASLARRASLV